MTQGRGRSGGRPGEDVSALDKRIIEHLQADGRRPFTQIAADLGVSEAAVRARTNRLVERGVLQVVGVTDPLRLGFQQMAMIGVKCEAERLMAVAEEIASFPEVDYVVVTAGSYDLLVETVAEDNEALLRFLADRLRRGGRRARDGDLRVPADGQADVPVGHPLGVAVAASSHGRIAALPWPRFQRAPPHPTAAVSAGRHRAKMRRRRVGKRPALGGAYA